VATRLRVLVVEDSASVLAMLYDTLQIAGFEVETAQTATEAVLLLTQHQYAAIVADCFLPDLPSAATR
jgi:two-component system, OmpR family, response regulator